MQFFLKTYTKSKNLFHYKKANNFQPILIYKRLHRALDTRTGRNLLNYAPIYLIYFKFHYF